jgi:hypothetical protein
LKQRTLIFILPKFSFVVAAGAQLVRLFGGGSK